MPSILQVLSPYATLLTHFGWTRASPLSAYLHLAYNSRNAHVSISKEFLSTILLTPPILPIQYTMPTNMNALPKYIFVASFFHSFYVIIFICIIMLLLLFICVFDILVILYSRTPRECV